jgi:hypothetical protein
MKHSRQVSSQDSCARSPSRPLAMTRLAAVAALLSSPAAAQATLEPLDSAFARWSVEHGPNWRMDVDEGTGAVEFLYGGNVPPPFVARDDEQWFALARHALAEAARLHRIEPQTLVEDRALFLPLGMVGTSDKMTVRFRQQVGGVPVDFGSVNVLFDAAGRLLSIQTHALPSIASFPVVAAIDAEAAAAVATGRFTADTALEGWLGGPPELVIAQLEQDGARVPRLVYKTTVQWIAPDFDPEGFTYFVDARTGEIAHRVRSIHGVDVGGTVTTKATDGVFPDSAYNFETQQVMRYARVQSSAGTAVTDASGNFVFPGVTGPLQCTFTYVGTYNNVFNDAGPEYSFSADLTGTGNTVLLNPGNDDYTTAQANVFVQINHLRDWIRSVNPLDATADFIHTANCNLFSSCNAFFDGASINFYIAHNNCPNMAYSTVIAHEDGHWLNVRYGIDNNPDGMGEGSADTFALYLYNDQYVARDFFGVGQPLRNGENTVQFCGDCCGSCHGGYHADGEVFMGACWKVRRNLVNSLGNGPGDALADALFLGWHNAYDQAQIKSIIESQWLTLDDNDGNINNGTPHFQEIDLAFREQGFPGVQFVPIQLSAAQVADTTDENGPYVAVATAASNIGATINSVTLNYRVGWTGAFTALPMTNTSGNDWSASIPGQVSPARVFYYVVAVDSAANNATYPTGGAGAAAYFSIGSLATVFTDDFETAKGWTASAGANVGSWERADPIGTLDGGAQAQPEDDNPLGTGTQCFFTGQGPVGGVAEANDVDLGPRTLTSAPLALSYGNAEIRYSYWVYCSASNDDLVVELSTDGTFWVTARTHRGTGTGSWQQGKVDVGSYVTPGATTFVRFRISDSPNDSITEAAIDDVRVSVLLPSGCSLPAIFCLPKIDSNFCIPRIGFDGFPSLGGNDPFDIEMSNASGQRNGLLFYGYGTNNSPFQGGVLCVLQPVRRTAVQSTGGTNFSCNGTMSFDFAAHARSGVDSLLVPGQACAAQYYYRDPLDPFGTALSDGVSFTICP